MNTLSSYRLYTCLGLVKRSLLCFHSMYLHRLKYKIVLTSFLFLSSSLLKLLSSKARKRLSTIKLPITSAGKNMKKQLSAPVSCSARIQSHRGSIHSPHRIRNIIINEWKKSLKFHLYKSSSQKHGQRK